MTVQNLQWFLTNTGVGDFRWSSLIDLPSTPDTVLLEFYSESNFAVFSFFEAGSQASATAVPKPLFYHYERDPETKMLIDLPSTPDTVLQYWEAGASKVVFLGTIDKSINPRVPVFTGDMGAYIG
jgi:hypothetical protein